MIDIPKFTGEQTKKIDELLRDDFKGATREDIELYASWKVAQAYKDEQFTVLREKAAKEYELEKQVCEAKVALAERTLEERLNNIRQKHEMRMKVNEARMKAYEARMKAYEKTNDEGAGNVK